MPRDTLCSQLETDAGPEARGKCPNLEGISSVFKAVFKAVMN
jgi:hypothetical protein